MSQTTSAPRRRPARKARPALVSTSRKVEIVGLMLMALALLITLAFVTYTPADADIARGIVQGQPRNLIGLVGARLAYVFVERGIGYMALLFGGLGFAWGYALFRHRDKYLLGLTSAFVSVAAFLLAALFAWFRPAEGVPSRWAGAWGDALARWLTGVLGSTGAFIALVLLLAVMVLVFVERDIQGAVDRVEDFFRGLRTRLAGLGGEIATRRAERRDASTAAPEPVTKTRRTKTPPALPEPEPSGDSAPVWAAPEPSAAPFPDPFASRSLGGTSRTPPAAPPYPPIPYDDAPFEDEDAEAPEALFSARPARPAKRPVVDDAAAEGDDVVLRVQPTREEARVDRLGPLDAEGEEVPYRPPSFDLLDPADGARPFDPEEIEENKQVLLDKLETYRIRITAINAIVGPTVTLYELTPAPGIKISRITALEDDLAMALAARGIRMIAPIPGKSAIGVEIPNRHRQMVRIRDVLATEKFKEAKMELPFPIGKSIEGDTFVEDLSKMPHVLIAGATGSGKSVGLNTLIAGLLYRCHPANLKFVFIDPKKIELTPYARLREHFIALPENYDEPVVTDFSMALGVLKSCEREMEKRYDLLSKAQVRGIKDYNHKLASGALETDRGHRHLPYVVVVVDELADLMMTAGKEIEGPIARLAQMARAVGIHLVLATQRPSVDVITGLIKANFPSRLAYQVASRIDSRTIIDQGGAEQLVGNGDLLYMNGSRMVRLQGPYVSMEEVERLVDSIADQEGPGPYRLPSFEDEADDPMLAPDAADRDDLFETAARVIVVHQQGSVSLLQRKLGIGYGRAARIVDQLERAGIVGRPEGNQKARAVLVQTESQLDSFFNGSGGWDDGDE